MNNNRNLQYYTNNNKCVSLPQKDDCDYLRISNYLSEYNTSQDKQQVLDNLGITDLVNNLYKLINAKFDAYATLKFLDDNYVKKIDLYYPEDEDDEDGFEPISYTGGDGSGFGWTVDDFLSLTSINPVQNRIITAALNQKADISSLQEYINLTTLGEYLSNYQPLLTPGFGIRIEGNIISSTLDLNPFIFVEELPDTGDPNKIYLTPDKTQPGYYIQYHYDPDKRKWIEIGRVSISSTLSGFLTLAEADARYLKKGELPSSVTYSIVNQVVNKIQKLLGNYVKKSEVYTPDLWGNDSSSEQIDDEDNGGNIDWSDIIGGGGGTYNITIDNVLDGKTLNPVTNRAIKLAFDTKQDKLTSLNAGSGIDIEDGIITCTFDTSVYEFVTTLPLNPKTNKIYLIKQDGTIYKQYIYENGWKYLGDIDLAFDITGYLSKNEAKQLYMNVFDLANTYLTRREFNEYFQGLISGGSSLNLTDYATKDYVDKMISQLDIDPSMFNQDGDFITLTTELAKKANISDVYTKTDSDTKYQSKGDYVYRNEFTSSLQSLNTRLDAFIIDETLSAVSSHAVQNKAIYAKLQEKLSTSEASTTYATKKDLTQAISSLDVYSGLKTINGQSLIGTGNIQINTTIDGIVTENSPNAVSSRAIYQYVNQNQLTPGSGISIENGVISVTLDAINPFIITDFKPTEGEANKLYLIKEQSGYRQWTYENDDWVDKGLLDLSVDLTNYVTGNDLTNFRAWVEDTFLKKEDVYTPDQGDTISNLISDSDPSSSGSSSDSGSILPPSQNEGGYTPGSAYYATNLADGIKTNVAVGNITANTDVSTLKGLSFSEILTRMLFKERYDNPGYSHLISIDTTQTIVKVGTVMETPTVVTNWNPNILPVQTIASNVLVKENNNEPQIFRAGSTYDNAGIYVFILNYSYPSGEYTITSNFGNTRIVGVNSANSSINKVVKVTYPWFINDVEQTTLVPLNENHTEEIFLTGSPKVSIPGENSICSIQADLGLGYMNVNWPKTTEVRNGVTYSVWTKPDTYLQNVKHKITFNIYMQ